MISFGMRFISPMREEFPRAPQPIILTFISPYMKEDHIFVPFHSKTIENALKIWFSIKKVAIFHNFKTKLNLL